MDKWHILPLTIADQQRHIEQSERLLAAVSAGGPATLYWSQARPAGLVLGFSQQAGQLNQEALAALDLPIYHRRAGGTAVFVGAHLLALDVALPAGHPLILSDLVESYRWLGETWVEALARLGISARVVAPSEARAQQALLKQEKTRELEALIRRACYGALSPYEVVADGARKVVGLDMIRRRNGSLLQAGVLLRWQSEPLAQVLGQTMEEQAILRTELPLRAVGLESLARRVISPDEVIEAFHCALRAL